MDNQNQTGSTTAGTVTATTTAAVGNTAAAPAASSAVQQPTERMFTQAELDQIVSDRLSRERQKYSDYNAVKSELADLKQKNAIRDIQEGVAAEKKVPAKLLTGETKEACEAQADAILAFARGSGAPAVPDGGEVHASGASTREQFAEVMGSFFG